MDAFELLLRASEPHDQLSCQINDNKTIFDYRKHMHNTILDPIDSIMLLAEQASKKSPIKRDLKAEPSIFNDNLKNLRTRRLRAMSEPWIKREIWHDDSALSDNKGSCFSSAKLLNSRRNVEMSAEENHDHESHTLPQMLDQYSMIYNKNGRIGIYTREERNAIILRFREKRKRRVWKKKIRYFCRKSLADSRVRVKGRFVKSATTSSASLFMPSVATIVTTSTTKSMSRASPSGANLLKANRANPVSSTSGHPSRTHSSSQSTSSLSMNAYKTNDAKVFISASNNVTAAAAFDCFTAHHNAMTTVTGTMTDLPSEDVDEDIEATAAAVIVMDTQSSMSTATDEEVEENSSNISYYDTITNATCETDNRKISNNNNNVVNGTTLPVVAGKYSVSLSPAEGRRRFTLVLHSNEEEEAVIVEHQEQQQVEDCAVRNNGNNIDGDLKSSTVEKVEEDDDNCSLTSPEDMLLYLQQHSLSEQQLQQQQQQQQQTSYQQPNEYLRTDEGGVNMKDNGGYICDSFEGGSSSGIDQMVAACTMTSLLMKDAAEEKEEEEETTSSDDDMEEECNDYSYYDSFPPSAARRIRRHSIAY